MKNYPAPNKTTLKVAEECGEVVQAANKLSEGRGTVKELHEEIVQALAMLMRLAIEGDATINLLPVLEKNHEA